MAVKPAANLDENKRPFADGATVTISPSYDGRRPALYCTCAQFKASEGCRHVAEIGLQIDTGDPRVRRVVENPLVPEMISRNWEISGSDRSDGQYLSGDFQISKVGRFQFATGEFYDKWSDGSVTLAEERQTLKIGSEEARALDSLYRKRLKPEKRPGIEFTSSGGITIQDTGEVGISLDSSGFEGTGTGPIQLGEPPAGKKWEVDSAAGTIKAVDIDPPPPVERAGFGVRKIRED